jgi:hypothetical protein
VALGPLIILGSHFLEILVIIQDWSFTPLRLPDALQRAIFAPGLSVGEVVLVEQSMPELIWRVDIILGVGGNAVLSGRPRSPPPCWQPSHLPLQDGDIGGLGAGLHRRRRPPHLAPSRGGGVKGRHHLEVFGEEN